VIAAVLLAGGLTTVLLSKRLAQPVTVVPQLRERLGLDGAFEQDGGDTMLVVVVADVETRAEDFDVQAVGRHDERRPAVVLDLDRVTTSVHEGAVKAYASGREQASVRLHPAQQLVFDTRTHAMRLTSSTRKLPEKRMSRSRLSMKRMSTL